MATPREELEKLRTEQGAIDTAVKTPRQQLEELRAEQKEFSLDEDIRKTSIIADLATGGVAGTELPPLAEIGGQPAATTKVVSGPEKEFKALGLLPVGTTEGVVKSLAGEPLSLAEGLPGKRLFQNDTAETIRRVAANTVIGAQSFAPGFVLAPLEDPVGMLEGLVKFMPELADKISIALFGQRSSLPTLHGQGFKVTKVTAEEQRQAQRELGENPFEILLAVAPFLRGVKAKPIKPLPKGVSVEQFTEPVVRPLVLTEKGPVATSAVETQRAVDVRTKTGETSRGFLSSIKDIGKQKVIPPPDLPTLRGFKPKPDQRVNQETITIKGPQITQTQLEGLGGAPKQVSHEITVPKVSNAQLDIVKGMTILAERPITRAKINLSLENPIRTFDRLGPQAKELFFDDLQDGLSLADKKFKQQKRFIGKVMKENGVTKKSSNKIGAHAIAEQTGGKEILAEMKVERPKLTPQETNVYNFMRSELENRYNQLQVTRKKSGQPPFPKTKNYFTFFKNIETAQKNGWNPVTMSPELGTGNIPVKGQTTRFRFAKNRSDDGTNIVELDAFGVYDIYNKTAFAHIEMGPRIAHKRQLVDGAFGDGFKLSEHNPQAYNDINQLLNFLSGTDGPILPKNVEIGMAHLNNNMAYSILSFNVRSAGIQPTALLHGSTLINPKWIGVGIKRNFSPEFRKRAFRRSKVISNREYDATVVEATKTMNGWLRGKQRKISEIGLKPLQLIDMETARIVWLGAEAKALKKFNMSLKEAASFADDVVTKTQASATALGKAPIQRTAIGRTLTTLQTFVINEFGYMRREVLGLGGRGLFTKTSASRFSQMMAGGTALGILFEDILGVNSPTPDPIGAFARELIKSGDPAGATWEATKEIIEGVPIIGGTVRYGSTILGPQAQLIGDIGKKIADTPGPTKPWLQLLGTVVGIPGTSQIVKEVKKRPGSLSGAIAGPTKPTVR